VTTVCLFVYNFVYRNKGVQLTECYTILTLSKDEVWVNYISLCVCLHYCVYRNKKVRCRVFTWNVSKLCLCDCLHYRVYRNKWVHCVESVLLSPVCLDTLNIWNVYLVVCLFTVVFTETKRYESSMIRILSKVGMWDHIGVCICLQLCLQDNCQGSWVFVDCSSLCVCLTLKALIDILCTWRGNIWNAAGRNKQTRSDQLNHGKSSCRFLLEFNVWWTENKSVVSVVASVYLVDYTINMEWKRTLKDKKNTTIMCWNCILCIFNKLSHLIHLFPLNSSGFTSSLWQWPAEWGKF